eukprot:GHVU01053959.1.p2 GENE.GHVU01053959.1~~GHVU01053959.1.p2  ORF type:complete len:130 (-),score=13.25 GHVU01053959.1:48-437(-)
MRDAYGSAFGKLHGFRQQPDLRVQGAAEVPPLGRSCGQTRRKPTPTHPHAHTTHIHTHLLSPSHLLIHSLTCALSLFTHPRPPSLPPHPHAPTPPPVTHPLPPSFTHCLLPPSLTHCLPPSPTASSLLH